MMGLNHPTIAVICVSLAFAGVGVHAQESRVLTLEELDDDGKTTKLDRKPLAIVDINSEIKVRLDPGALQTAVAQLLGPDAVSDELINRARALQRTAQEGLEQIEPLSRALSVWAKSAKTPDDLAELSRALNESARPVLKVIDAAEDDPTLRARLNAALETVLGAPRAAQNRALFEAAAAYAGQLRQTIDETLQKEGAYVQLGAWIVQDGQDRPLHLRGFDAYPEGDFFVVDQWTLLPLNETQKQQLKDLEKAAKTINESGIEGLLKVEGITNGVVAEFLDRALDCVDKIEKAFLSLRGAVDAEAESISKLLDEARRNQQQYMIYLLSLKAKYDSESAKRFSSGAALLESTHADLVALQQRTKSFVSEQLGVLYKLQKEVKTSPMTVQEALDEAVDVVRACEQEVLERVANSAGHLSELLKGALFSQQINAAVLEFAEEVLKHTVDKVPQRTELKLKQTGMRKAGDVVVLKLAAGGAKRQREVLEERRLDLYRVLPHIGMSIGLIFADPTGTTGVQNRFQAAPSYSILLKGFGKRGVTYNRLLTPGLGLNVAALDFDKDDTPELGIAIVGSVLRDYLQLGYGYNVNEDVAYWFFGLRLPLATFTLPRPENLPPP
jgi:hypothetical protein